MTTAIEYDFEIAFTPADCNFIKSYDVFVNSNLENPDWVTIDTTSVPHKVYIFSTDSSLVGVYSVAIQSKLNNKPANISTDKYEFVINIFSEPCSDLVFDPQVLP